MTSKTGNSEDGATAPAAGVATPSTSICKAAASYAAQCKSRGVRVKIPSGCVRCQMDGETMLERDMKVISSPPEGSPTFRSTDVVFIVETKDCNRALKSKTKLDTVAQALEKELGKKGFKNNRYAAVVFGGDGVYNQPHSIVQKGQVFAPAEEIGGFLTSVQMGKGNNDTFQAIWYALQNLLFRPGVSKTFILFPCTGCNPQQMKVIKVK